jgi:hypothetical protein
MYLDLPLERPIWADSICPDHVIEQIVDMDAAGNVACSPQVPPVAPRQAVGMQRAQQALTQLLLENQAGTVEKGTGEISILSDQNEDSATDESPAPTLQECMPPPAAFPAVRGTALLVTTCSMNHSCSPNVSVIWNESGEAVVVANRHIAEDEELCISYVDEGLEYSERQEMLHGYGFGCDATCDRCRFDHDFFSAK